jgi:hypothetical protein
LCTQGVPHATRPIIGSDEIIVAMH